MNREAIAKAAVNHQRYVDLMKSVGYNHWIFTLLREGTLPGRHQIFDKSGWMLESCIIRDIYNAAFGFPLITQEVIAELKIRFESRKILEVGAGTGYLAKLLQDLGINIKPTDTNDWAKNGNSYYRNWNQSFTEVEEIDALEAIDKYGDEYDTVLISWPPYLKPLAYDVLTKCLEKGLKLIYIGEDEGGCTADDAFFRLVEEKCDMDVFADSYTPFWGIHDRIYEITAKE